MLEKLPLPIGLPWELQFVFWVLCGTIILLFAACLWWLARFVKAHDDFKSDVSASLVSHGDKMTKAVEKVKETSEKIEQSAIKFQQDTHIQMMAVHKQVVDFGSTIEISKNKVELMNKQIDIIQKTSDHNAEALKKSSDILTVHQRLIDSQANVLKTLIKKLGSETVMVTTKSPKKKTDSNQKQENIWDSLKISCLLLCLEH